MTYFGLALMLGGAVVLLVFGRELHSGARVGHRAAGPSGPTPGGPGCRPTPGGSRWEPVQVGFPGQGRRRRGGGARQGRRAGSQGPPYRRRPPPRRAGPRPGGRERCAAVRRWRSIRGRRPAGCCRPSGRLRPGRPRRGRRSSGPRPRHSPPSGRPAPGPGTATATAASPPHHANPAAAPAPAPQPAGSSRPPPPSPQPPPASRAGRRPVRSAGAQRPSGAVGLQAGRRARKPRDELPSRGAQPPTTEPVRRA